MNKLFNSIIEMESRLCILLSELPDEFIDIEKMVALDFIAVYGSVFGISSRNLHTETGFMYGELASKRELVHSAVKELVLDGLIDFSTVNGFEYRISDIGYEYADSFQSRYAYQYRKAAANAVEKYYDISTTALMTMIQQKALGYVRGDE